MAGQILAQYGNITIMNHIAQLDWVDQQLTIAANPLALDGLQLTYRYQQARGFCPAAHVPISSKVCFSPVSEAFVQNDAGVFKKYDVTTNKPYHRAQRQDIRCFFANVTSLGEIAKNFVFDKSFVSRYHIAGIVESHLAGPKVPDLIAKARAHGYIAHVNPAEKSTCSEKDTHGGEFVLSGFHTFSLPIDPIIIEQAEAANDQIRRWQAVEIRVSQVSFLFVVGYFWCSEGLSPRNWAILQQLSVLLGNYKLPFVLCADFNFPPELLYQSGWCQYHHSEIKKPDLQTTCVGSKNVIDYCVFVYLSWPYLLWSQGFSCAYEASLGSRFFHKI